MDGVDPTISSAHSAAWLRAAADRVERGEATVTDSHVGIWSDGPGTPRGTEVTLTIRERPNVETFGVEAPELTMRELALTEGLVARSQGDRVGFRQVDYTVPELCPEHGKTGPLVSVEWQEDKPDGWRSARYHCGCGFTQNDRARVEFVAAPRG